jgi:phosphatidylserine/phosphatidylglycerophosphate/cardiolipin synthase-like enzyme
MATKNPAWDTGCTVTPLIGGFAAMDSIRSSLEAAISEASGQPAGQRGYVYVAGWRIDPVRDLSSGNSWTTGPWSSNSSVPATNDETAIGLFLRVLQAGIKLRILVWLPDTFERIAFQQHFQESYSLFRIIQEQSEALASSNSSEEPLGLVALDTRIGAITGTHHQKMMVIRGAGATQVAYCGGVDLAFTRRDAPPPDSENSIAVPQFNAGDWQSASTMPLRNTWPMQSGLTYPEIYGSNTKMGTDLPEQAYGTTDQIWHDQHLMLQGPIVATLENQFRERWIDPMPGDKTGSATSDGPSALSISRNCVFVSDGSAVQDGQMIPLEQLDADTIAAVQSPSSSGSSIVQMWRTIPIRKRGSSPAIYGTGEFSNLSGIANACTQASELIWIFDQYFWSLPLARLLNRLITAENSNLCLIIILPPYPDDSQCCECYLRLNAILELTSGFQPQHYQRLEIYNLWHYKLNQGIYCHAKVQIYDGSLLVCGSCNLNQRSLLCDSELACAVLDPEVVAAHQNNLWQLLFSSAPSSPISISASGSGQTFLASFQQAVSAAVLAGDSFLVEDEYYYSRRVLGKPQNTSAFEAYTTPPGWTAPPGYHARTVPTMIIPLQAIEPSSLKQDFPSDPSAGEVGHPLALDVISQYLTTPPQSTTYRSRS